MATEQVERELRRRLRELLGDVAAMALIEKFPPDERLDALRDEMHAGFENMERRFAQMGVETDGRFGQMATRVRAGGRPVRAGGRAGSSRWTAGSSRWNATSSASIPASRSSSTG